MILHRLFAVTDLLGNQYSVVHRCLLPALCTKQGRDDETDASKIMFYNDPDDNVPLPPVPSNDTDDNVPSTEPKKNAFSVLLKTAHTPATVTAGSRRSGRPSKPSARIRDADNVASSSGTRKRARASSSATEHPASKKVAMRFISPLDSDDEDMADEDLPSAALDPGESSSDELIPQLDDDDDEAESQTASQTVSKSDHTADIQTIFTRIPEGWVCMLCKDAGEPAHKHTFHGGTSMLRMHIVCHRRTHFQVYKARCDAAGITMHSHAIPPGKDLTTMQQTLDRNLVSKPAVFTKEGLLEYIMELIVTEDEVHFFYFVICIAV
ncbi:hypothetical protein EV702DRAFT_1051228 [Suillus placidus]|uniref:Uncharacterized protein n=1 Tax=Suillus placidus TaxID=48579 RepID=A0A9P6ZGC5_9AGAM|nr:hypothetical protein EV702DRAFT_1051228 [Suillus placidus]